MELVFGMVFGIIIFMIGGIFPIFLEKLKLELQIETLEVKRITSEEENEEEYPETPETVVNVRSVEKPVTPNESYYDELRKELAHTEGLFDVNPPQYNGETDNIGYYPIYDDSVEIITPEHEREEERRANRL